MIKGGYILKPRIIQDSDISDCSPCVRETWDYLIREANHKEYKNGGFKIERGQLFRSYDEIIDDLSWKVGWRKETYTKNQMKKCMKLLREAGRITTQKEPGGVLITICKYSFYQEPDNYERTTEGTIEGTNEEPSRNHRGTSHNYKNEKNVKNEKKTIYAFDNFWDDYDRKKDKKKAHCKWEKISEKEREKIKEFIPIYKAYQPDSEYRKHPTTFLNSEIWNDDWSAYPAKHKNNGKAEEQEVYVFRENIERR